MSQNIKENNEIDLMDLVKIFYRKRIMIIGVIIAFLFLSLGAALYIRTQKKNSVSVVVKMKDLDQSDLNKIGVTFPRISIANALNNDEVLKKIIKIPGIEEEFKKTGRKKIGVEEREFISKKFKVINEDNKGEFKITLKEIDKIEVLAAYLKVINSYYLEKYSKLLDERNQVVSKSLEEEKERLSKINKEIKLIFEREKKILSGEQALMLINLKYPKLTSEQEILKRNYSLSLQEKEAIKNVETRISNIFTPISSIYEEKGGSKAKLVLLSGMIFGILLALGLALFLEFWKAMKAEITEEDRKKLKQ